MIPFFLYLFLYKLLILTRCVRVFVVCIFFFVHAKSSSPLPVRSVIVVAATAVVTTIKTIQLRSPICSRCASSTTGRPWTPGATVVRSWLGVDPFQDLASVVFRPVCTIITICSICHRHHRCHHSKLGRLFLFRLHRLTRPLTSRPDASHNSSIQVQPFSIFLPPILLHRTESSSSSSSNPLMIIEIRLFASWPWFVYC